MGMLCVLAHNINEYCFGKYGVQRNAYQALRGRTTLAKTTIGVNFSSIAGK